ncbi:MAG: hypothetical protein KGH64_04705 [Candidatus Micrarchaeota archaeon]|nr:hypothetical protein [Candidatus Micrarchaeota archaeon]MDE1834612.1 hypothetical protein [Candidatus Micrarchaeota archaeon]
MLDQEKAVDRAESKLYLFSKEGVSEVELYPGLYVDILGVGIFVGLLFLGIFLLIIGIIIDYYFSCWVFKQLLGEPKLRELEGLSYKDVKMKAKVNQIPWVNVTKVEIKEQYLDLYVNGKRKGLFIKSDKKQMIGLLSSKLKDKLKINDKTK